MNYLIPYLPIGMLLAVAIIFGISNVLIGSLIGPKRPNPSKSLAYESGLIPIGEANVRVPIKFYMVALLFLLFDIETVFILAWAVIFRGEPHMDFESGKYAFTQQAFTVFAFFEMLVFVIVLAVGYIYVWRKGGLKWS